MSDLNNEHPNDVFLSHNSHDKDFVRKIAEHLADTAQLKVWFDEWDLIPGERWILGLNQALKAVRSVAVFVGANGYGYWQEDEIDEVLLVEASERKLRIIPVVIPGASDKIELYPFLTRYTWVNLRGGLADDGALWRLECGIRGDRPGRGRPRRQEQRPAGGTVITREPSYTPIIARLKEDLAGGGQSVELLSANLPNRDYNHFIGRVTQLGSLVKSLSDPDDRTIRSLYGLGGIGKTSLALEAAYTLVSLNSFAHIVWISAASARFDGERIQALDARGQSPDALNFERLLTEIARQCGLALTARDDTDYQRTVVSRLLRDEKSLVILDNFESAPQPDRIVGDLFEILGRSRLLITSRPLINHSLASAVLVGGFETPEESLNFLRADAQVRNITAIAKASEGDLRRIHERTGGAPLAMKLVVGQINSYGLAQSLEYLTHTNSGPNKQFYSFLYLRSWDSLSNEAQSLLIALASFSSTSGASQIQLQKMDPTMAEDTFLIALRELIASALAERYEKKNKNFYKLHPLTYSFMKTDIRKDWAKTDE